MGTQLKIIIPFDENYIWEGRKLNYPKFWAENYLHGRLHFLCLILPATSKILGNIHGDDLESSSLFHNLSF